MAKSEFFVIRKSFDKFISHLNKLNRLIVHIESFERKLFH